MDNVSTLYPKSKVLDLLARRDVHDVVVAVEAGSVAHNISVGNTDQDYVIIRFESWFEFVNGPGDRQSMEIRTAQQGVRSGPGDIDLSVYTLRKFAHLAMSGNPTILSVLWSPNRFLEREEWSRFAKELKGFVPSKAAGQAFLGYMKQQMERWAGSRGQKNVNRPELVAAYGFDTKYAAQIIKLGIQGIRFVTDGIMEVPIEEPNATEIRSLRTGDYTEAQALDWAKAVEDRLKDAIDNSALPEYPNRVGVQHLVASTYGVHYSSIIK